MITTEVFLYSFSGVVIRPESEEKSLVDIHFAMHAILHAIQNQILGL